MISGTAARQAETKPFMSAAPRAYSRPSAAAQRERIGAPGLAVHRHGIDVTGQRDAARTLRPDDGVDVGLLAVASVLTRYGTPCASRYSRTKAISARFELRLVVSNDTSLASSSVVVLGASMGGELIRVGTDGQPMAPARGGMI